MRIETRYKKEQDKKREHRNKQAVIRYNSPEKQEKRQKEKQIKVEEELLWSTKFWETLLKGII